MRADFWLKWIATALLIAGAILTSADIRPWNIWAFNLGNVCWIIVGFMWREWSLVILNSVLTGIYAIGLIKWII